MRLSRRTLLVASGTSIAVAGCLGNGDDPEDDDVDPEGDDEDPSDEEPDDDAEQGNDEPEVETVRVGPDGDHRFDPDTLEIETGTPVEFVWEAGGHNIAVTDQPDEADWEGVSELGEEGDTHEHTFEVDGRYEYVCEPHVDAGMEGVILVGDGDETDDAEAGDETDDDDGTGGY